MVRDPTQVKGMVRLGAKSASTVGTGRAGAVLPGSALSGPRFRIAGARAKLSRRAYGLAALVVLVAGCLAIVAFASAGPTVLAARSAYAFPGWLAGPLHGLFGPLTHDRPALNYGLSVVLIAMTVAYGISLGAVRVLSLRTIVVAIVALHAVMLLSPPLELTDIFNYLGYARLGALHDLNPYTHVIAIMRHDPVYGLASWRNLRSPYGPVFTLLTYPLGLIGLPMAYWVLKTSTILAGLACVALVGRCARQLGRDPRFAILFLAANPIFLVYELGGFHNDVFMLLPALAAISLLLDRRDGWAGVSIMLAIAVKFTAGLLVPFLLLAARPGARRRVCLLAGMALTVVPLAAASYAAFGFATPNLADQSSLLTVFSVPNIVGLILGLGGGNAVLLRIGSVAVVLVVAALVKRRGDWLSGAGWATLALICSLAWLVPWYIVWLLPLAALGTSIRLRRATMVLTVFLVLTFLPLTTMMLSDLGVKLMTTPLDHASAVRQLRLER